MLSRNKPWRNKCLGEVWDGRKRTSWNFSRQHFAISCTRCCLQFLHYIRLYSYLGGPQLFPSFCWLSWSCLVNIGEPSVILLQESRAVHGFCHQIRPSPENSTLHGETHVQSQHAQHGKSFPASLQDSRDAARFWKLDGVAKIGLCRGTVGLLLVWIVAVLSTEWVNGFPMDFHNQSCISKIDWNIYSDKQTFVLSNWRLISFFSVIFFIKQKRWCQESFQDRKDKNHCPLSIGTCWLNSY